MTAGGERKMVLVGLFFCLNRTGIHIAKMPSGGGSASFPKKLLKEHYRAPKPTLRSQRTLQVAGTGLTGAVSGAPSGPQQGRPRWGVPIRARCSGSQDRPQRDSLWLGGP